MALTILKVIDPIAFKIEPPRDKTNKMADAPSEDWSDWASAWASAQSDQSLRWALNG